jgi:hypothetical protein
LKRHRLNALLDDLSSSSEDEDDSPPVNAMLPSHPLARFMNSRTDSNNNNVNGGQGSRKSKSPPLPRTIFQRALEASHLTWDDAHLRFILDNDNYSIKSQPSYSMMSCPSGPSSRGSSHYYHGGNYGGFPSTSSNCAASSSSSSSSSYSTAPSSSSSNSAQFTSQGYPLWNGSYIFLFLSIFLTYYHRLSTRESLGSMLSHAVCESFSSVDGCKLFSCSLILCLLYPPSLNRVHNESMYHSYCQQTILTLTHRRDRREKNIALPLISLIEKVSS